MQVRVLFFGILKDIAGKASDEVSLPEGATVRDLLSHYAQDAKLKGMLGSIAVALNQEYAARTAGLHEQDEVGLLPPVSGGADSTQPATQSRVQLSSERIDTAGLAERMKRAEDGAVVVFEGIVRDNSRGRRTLYLDYEAYEEMARKQLEELAAQALSKFKVREVAVAHRLGRLQIGETSVAIVVSSAHRAAAFDACRWMIDTLKQTVPIWKKEHFEDGAVWADGEPFPPEVRRA
ncbi:MAG: molybdenum cofactor biosynthesis protein MoaE [Acidobacteriia bacterium]|nr:molybdenum cofactor biosynthesis protein MoaE [Terriglobia bacterium]